MSEMYKRAWVLGALLWGSSLHGQAIVQAVCAKDGKAHLTYANKTRRVIPAEPKQVACEEIRVAADKRTVAWSVLVENCCTSYPIPISVVVYRGARRVVMAPGQMVWQWHFEKDGAQIAMLWGPVHGFASAASLYDTRTGKLLTLWRGDSPVPEWGKQWEEEFVRRDEQEKQTRLQEFGREYAAAWCSHNAASVAELFSQEGSLTINDGAPSHGRKAIAEAAQSFMTAFPDLSVVMDNLVIKDDGVEFHWTLTGTNTGPGGTGNRVRISGFESWKMGKDGLIAASEGHFDAKEYER